MDETTHSNVRSLIMWPLSTAVGGENTRPVQQVICNNNDFPLGLLGQPVGGQATAQMEDGRS